MSRLIVKFLRNGIYRSFIFHIVVRDKNAKKGSFIEKLGYYSPISSINGKKELVVNFMKLAF
jgi:ribosomal protein S16